MKSQIAVLSLPPSIPIFPHLNTIYGHNQTIRMTWDKKHAEEGAASITTNEEFLRDTEGYRKCVKSAAYVQISVTISWRLCVLQLY